MSEPDDARKSIGLGAVMSGEIGIDVGASTEATSPTTHGWRTASKAFHRKALTHTGMSDAVVSMRLQRTFSLEVPPEDTNVLKEKDTHLKPNEGSYRRRVAVQHTNSKVDIAHLYFLFLSWKTFK